MNPSTETTPALWRRLAAAAYDSLIVVALWFLGTALILPLTGGEAVDPRTPGGLLYQLYLLAIGFLFFGGFWTHGGQTLGMLAWRVKLVPDADGGRVTWAQALKRYLAAILSWVMFGAGFWWACFDREKRTWHDRLSGTRLMSAPYNVQLSNQ
ncbi:MAG TPA: RDD family protein [Gammaproteobacteria bacterium]|nr:RDD family protein [Gammaproteobacteria bacterium]